MELLNDNALDTAVQAGDYAAFRKAASTYEEPIRKRVEAWTTRHPDLVAQVGGAAPAASLLEEVFLHAFEHYGERPPGMRSEEWLDQSFDAVTRSAEQHVGNRQREVGFERTDEPRRE